MSRRFQTTPPTLPDGRQHDWLTCNCAECAEYEAWASGVAEARAEDRAHARGLAAEARYDRQWGW